MSTNGNHQGGNATNGNGYKVPTGRGNGSSSGRKRLNGRATGTCRQMHFARNGMITEEMAFVAEREKISSEKIRKRSGEGNDDYSRQHQSR